MALIFMYNARNKIQTQIDPKIKPIDTILEKLSPEDLCVFWFIGTKDLTQGSLDLMCSSKKKRISKLLDKNIGVCLVDLMAWQSFEVESDPTTVNSLFEPLLSCLSEKGIWYLTASLFFQKLTEIDQEDMIDWVQAICEREELYIASSDQNPSDRKLSMLYDRKQIPRALQTPKLMNQSLPKLYSVFQYLEIFFYIEEILINQMSQQSRWVISGQGLDLNINFVLPNDESKYYLNHRNDLEFSNAQFQEDLETFLQLRGLLAQINSLTISIECFSYYETKNIKARPYQAGKSILEPNGSPDIEQLFSRLNLNHEPKKYGVTND